METEGKILIVEDQAEVREFLAVILRDQGFEVEVAADAVEAVGRIGRESFDLVLAGGKPGAGAGLELLKHLLGLADPPAVIGMSAHPPLEAAVRAIKLGAFDFLELPQGADQLLIAVRRGVAHRRLQRRVRRLESQLEREAELEALVAKSAKMRQVVEVVRQVAKSDATVLVEGESGVGKELVARAIHALSRRRGQAFVAISCGALPESLLESEMFGYVKGAFTGADDTRAGLFEEAGGGTLFLDEIGETSPAFQVKLLRALQEREIRRVGDHQTIPIDLRVIAASNRDLKTLVEAGRFRQDLFYRVNVIRIELPPLRERKEDIVPLARFFIKRHATSRTGPVPDLSSSAGALLEAYPWPGNVRELENAIERALVLARSATIEAIDLPAELKTPAAPTTPDPQLLSLRELERLHIIQTLKRLDWNQTAAAKALGIGYNTLWRKMKQYNLKRPS